MPLTLERAALAAAARLAPEQSEAPEARFAAQLRAEAPDLEEAITGDAPLARLGRAMSLSPAEVATAALCAAVERDPSAGRLLAWLQAPLGGSRPTLGLCASVFRDLDGHEVSELATGSAIGAGLLTLLEGGGPLPERALALPPHLLMAASGRLGSHPEGRPGPDPDSAPLPPSILEAAERHAMALALDHGRSLVIRSGHPGEARAAAAAIADALGRMPLFLGERAPPGLVPWLHLSGLVPVFQKRMAPSELFKLPKLAGWTGPVLVVSGPEGSVESPRGAALSWSVPVPGPDEREALWKAALGERPLAITLARSHRHGAGRIAELGRLARHYAAVDGRDQVDPQDIVAASWEGEGGGLSALAQALPDRVEDDGLVLSVPLREDLELVLARCRQREGLVEGLGGATTTRYRAGVRVLFVGPSGTGKTLAASWIATKLALPLYRVDLASVVSKYIGETEKNLAELLARAEAAEVVLFFDEADTLFGKRTDVRHSTDRFANAQTNYLLQRIEAYDGVVVLASNSRARFDPSFARRLDAILEFPPPGPEERRALWIAHLGEGQALSPKQLNQLAAGCDLAGGHVRNVVLAAATLARSQGRGLQWEDLLAGLRLEYRKVGRPVPSTLQKKPR
ncbi:MAG: ATP-binding protein [Alphaproteobacteria bacterium]|nr:ATP-binding protein [Alphaproteobacteria bacterium]MCB9791527.1 ATP-binding protein [Alphaproteobacteria bacterium]